MTAPATGPRPTRDPLVVVTLFVSVASLVVSLVTLVVVSTGGRTSDAADSPAARPAGPPVAPGPSGPPGDTRTTLDVPCPAGRTGTYDYRLSVTLEIEGRPVYTDAAHGSDGLRGDCGTGVS